MKEQGLLDGALLASCPRQEVAMVGPCPGFTGSWESRYMVGSKSLR